MANRRKKKVLIADDEGPVRTTLRKFLISLGIEEVLEAASGEEAVQAVRSSPDIQLVLLDLKMPGMDGLQALEQIRGLSADVKVAVLTGYPFYGQADQTVQKLGVTDFIVKPVDLDYLERLVSAVLSG